jgi:salicylate hydroxylase
LWSGADFLQGFVALLGDSCHPSVPYAASGAAMAVEDGIVLGRLIGLFSRCDEPNSSIPDLLQLYQDLRKERATSIVNLANGNQELYEMRDGEQQEQRDREFAEHGCWDKDPFPWAYADYQSCKDLYAFHALGSADEGFAKSWFAKEHYHRSAKM